MTISITSFNNSEAINYDDWLSQVKLNDLTYDILQPKFFIMNKELNRNNLTDFYQDLYEMKNLVYFILSINNSKYNKKNNTNLKNYHILFPMEYGIYMDTINNLDRSRFKDFSFKYEKELEGIPLFDQNNFPTPLFIYRILDDFEIIKDDYFSKLFIQFEYMREIIYSIFHTFIIELDLNRILYDEKEIHLILNDILEKGIITKEIHPHSIDYPKITLDEFIDSEIIPLINDKNNEIYACKIVYAK